MTPQEYAGHQRENLAVLELAQAVLDEVAQVMRDWAPSSTLGPQEWGAHVWKWAPDIGDAARKAGQSRYITGKTIDDQRAEPAAAQAAFSKTLHKLREGAETP